MTPLRVLHVDTGRTWRGGQAQVDLLAGGLAALGHDQLVAAPPGPLAARVAARGIAVTRFAPRGDVDAAAALALAARARAFAPDIVHLHDARAHALGWVAALVAGAACVVSRRVAFGTTVRLPHGFKYRRLPVDRYLALSQPIRAELEAIGVPAERIDLVPDAVDVAAVVRAVEAARADGTAGARRRLVGDGLGRVVGTIAALTPEKGQDLLLEAASRGASRPGVLLHGSGPGGAALRARAESDPRVAGIAFVEGEDIFVTLAALDALVVPSRAEGLGSIVLAAQAAGVPVVASRAGGLPEIVVHERTGLLVPPEDVAALAAALDRLFAAPEETAARVRAAREAVVQHDAERIAARTVASYAAARARRAAAAPGPR